jgi:hypothetical protein
MQRGLIDNRASYEGLAVLFKRDGQAPKPVRPLGTQVTPDPYLIDHRPAWISYWIKYIRHYLAPFAAGHNNPRRLLNAPAT